MTRKTTVRLSKVELAELLGADAPGGVEVAFHDEDLEVTWDEPFEEEEAEAEAPAEEPAADVAPEPEAEG